MADGAAKKITAEDIRAALKLRFEAAQYALLWEVANGTGAHSRRFADAVAFGLWPSHGNKVEGIEIKVSRSDFLNELKQPEKSTPIYQHCHHWWLACPAGMVKVDEVPPTWGLLELGEGGTMRAKKKAPLLEPIDMPRTFIAALLRRHAGLDEALTKREVDRRCQAIAEAAEKRIKEEVDRRVGERTRSVEAGLAKLETIREATGLDFGVHRWGLDRVEPDRFIAAVKVVQAMGTGYSAPLESLRANAARVIKAIDECGLLPQKEAP